MIISIDVGIASDKIQYQFMTKIQQTKDRMKLSQLEKVH